MRYLKRGCGLSQAMQFLLRWHLLHYLHLLVCNYTSSSSVSSPNCTSSGDCVIPWHVRTQLKKVLLFNISWVILIWVCLSFLWNTDCSRTHEKLSLIKYDINDLILKRLRRINNIWHIFTCWCVQPGFYTCFDFSQTLWSWTGEENFDYSCRRSRSALNFSRWGQNFPPYIIPKSFMYNVIKGHLKISFSSHAGWLTENHRVFSRRDRFLLFSDLG